MFFDGVWHGLDEAFFMFWDTIWALVLGFVLSGAVQAFVSRSRMRSSLGGHGPRELGRASFFGVVSSSCSYASSALAKSLFARGADFTAAIVFMVASTNLVVELGIVLWLLIGWQFALAEFVGGAIMIVLLGLVVPRAVPASWIERARERLDDGGGADDPHDAHAVHEAQATGDENAADKDSAAEDSADEESGRSIRTRKGWGDAAGYTVSDLTMLRKELVIGFVVAGFLAALVPSAFWQSIFLTGHGFLSSLENVVLGPFLALVSFVCSVGNVPLAAALWHGGISFGGVVSFVFADLITLPLLMIYRKYYGLGITLRLLGVMWATMSAAGLAVEYLFRVIDVPSPSRPRVVAHEGFSWNYTTVLNIVALVAFAVVYFLYRTRDTSDGRYAKDPVCGMQVEIANAPARRTVGGQTSWFCSDHCATRFDGRGHGVDDAPADTVVDPVCGMTVDPAHAAATRTVDGQTYHFCSTGCADHFASTRDAADAASPGADADRRGGVRT